MIRAILFDMGGTLDGDGVHWLDRFEILYARAGVAVAARRRCGPPSTRRSGGHRLTTP